MKLAVLAGVAPDRLTEPLIEARVAAMTAAIRRHRPDGPGVGHLTGAVFGAHTVLFHLGVLDAPPRIQQPNLQAAREAAWAQVPPRLAATLHDYIAQVRLSLRPGTIVRIEGVLREFAGWIAVQAPDVGAVADLRRPHIEAYKLHLAARPSARGGRLSKLSLAEHLGALRTCFERLTEWRSIAASRGPGTGAAPAARRWVELVAGRVSASQLDQRLQGVGGLGVQWDAAFGVRRVAKQQPSRPPTAVIRPRGRRCAVQNSGWPSLAR